MFDIKPLMTKIFSVKISQKFVLREFSYEIGEEGNLIAGGAEVFESEVRRWKENIFWK